MTKIVIPDAAFGGHQASTDWDKLMDPARKALEALIAKGDEMADRIEELEAKLAKAVEALESLADCVDDGCFCSEMRMATVMDIARTTLAEIKGESHD